MGQAEKINCRADGNGIFAGATAEFQPSEGSTPSMFVISLVLVFLCVSLINILNHEMWGDELQSWLIAKNSSSLANLFHNARYEEGHPKFWCLCLYFLSRFTDQPIIMQIFHLLIATATIYIFARFSPFTRLQKILFSFGYFPLYEYGTISRSYAFGTLFIFGFCAAFRTRIRKYLLPVCLLFMLTQTSVYGLIIAILCGSMLAYEYFTQDYLREASINRRMQLAICLSILILGILCSILQLIPPSDSGVSVAELWMVNLKIENIPRTFSTVWTSYIPIPKLDYHFWNTNILTSQRLRGWLSCFLLSLSLLFFRKKPIPLFFYLFGTGAILVFTNFMYFGSLRHHGHLFIIFIASLWISNYYPDQEFRLWPVNKLNNSFDRYKNIFVVLLLATHVVAGLFASAMDWVHPFSASKAVANFIKDRGMENMVILGYPDTTASAVSGYLNRMLYYPSGNRFGSFIIFEPYWNRKVSEEEVLRRAEQLMVDRKSDLLLLLHSGLKNPTDSIAMLKEFNESIVEDETFFLYLMRYHEMKFKGNT